MYVCQSAVPALACSSILAWCNVCHRVRNHEAQSDTCDLYMVWDEEPASFLSLQELIVIFLHSEPNPTQPPTPQTPVCAAALSERSLIHMKLDKASSPCTNSPESHLGLSRVLSIQAKDIQ